MTKRTDLDVSPIGPWRTNYDYGEGLHSGEYKSVTEFLNKKRKRRQRKRAMLELLLSTNNLESNQDSIAKNKV
jgi:hypothetical protein